MADEKTDLDAVAEFVDGMLRAIATLRAEFTLEREIRSKGAVTDEEFRQHFVDAYSWVLKFLSEDNPLRFALERMRRDLKKG